MTKLGRPYSNRPKETMVRVDFYIEPYQDDYLNQVVAATPFNKAELIRKALELWIRLNPADKLISNHPKIPPP